MAETTSVRSSWSAERRSRQVIGRAPLAGVWAAGDRGEQAGAGATIGADFVAKAKPDGYTLLVGAVHHTIASSIYRKLPYDFQKDFVPLTIIAMVPNVLVVNAANPAKSVAELVAHAKAAKPELSCRSNSNWTAQHLIGTQFQSRAI